MARAPIISFSGEFRCLSNFWLCDVEYDRVLYSSVEHAFQAAKTLDPEEREDVRCASTPGRAKYLGRHSVTLRPGWDEMKVSIMEELVREKFERHPLLARRLLSTGDAELVEGNNWHDNFFGDCHCGRSGCGNGKNVLGRILMKVRAELATRHA